VLEKAASSISAALSADASLTRVCVTGHSLGAGAAQLATMCLAQDRQRFGLPSNVSIECAAFAPPPLFRAGEDDEGGEDAAYLTRQIDTYFFGTDVVPRLSLATVSK